MVTFYWNIIDCIFKKKIQYVLFDFLIKIYEQITRYIALQFHKLLNYLDYMVKLRATHPS